jgi:hypothetical protein
MRYDMKSIFWKIAFVTTIAATIMPAAHAQMPLDLITYYRADTEQAYLLYNVTSPGDLDGDGYSELFACEAALQKRVFVFSGADLPSKTPVKTLYDKTFVYNWVKDINGDGVDDFVIRQKYQDTVDVVEIWFGGTDFVQKSALDLIIRHKTDTLEGLGYFASAGDVNGDGWNDLVLPAMNANVYPYDGRFCIFFGGNLLDTMCDGVITIYDKGNGYDDFWVGTGLGDINGDGLMDYGFSGTKTNNPGYVSIIFGSIPLDTVADLTFWSRWEGYGAERFGWGITPLGDLNKDGYDDFAVLGGSYPCLYCGGNPFDTIPIILGDTTDWTKTGDRVARVGDINHDGWDDLAVASPAWGLDKGIVYIYYGYRVMNGDIDLTLRSTETSPLSDKRFGESVGPAGDFDGDGIDDIAISGSDLSGDGRGFVFVYAGSDTLPTSADEVDEHGQLPANFNILGQNYPNPFNNVTTIEYMLWGVSERHVELSIYNMLGQRVRSLINGALRGGSHIAFWNGTDDSGRQVASGVYYYILRSDHQQLSKKMIFLK